MEIQLDNLTLKQFMQLKKINANEKNYESKIEYYSDILQVALNKSADEIEGLDIHEFKKLANEFNLTNITISTIENEFKYDGQVYITSASNNEFQFKVKEIQNLEKIIKNEDTEAEIAAIIWREKGEDGKPINDFSTEGIYKRKEIFHNHMTLKYLMPYMDKLVTYLTQK
jgi:hypothetical protein